MFILSVLAGLKELGAWVKAEHNLLRNVWKMGVVYRKNVPRKYPTGTPHSLGLKMSSCYGVKEYSSTNIQIILSPCCNFLWEQRLISALPYFCSKLIILHQLATVQLHLGIYCTLAIEGALWNIRPPLIFGFNFLLRSKEYELICT